MKTAWALGIMAVMLASPVAAQDFIDDFATIPGRDSRMQATAGEMTRYQPGGAYYQQRQRYAATAQAPSRAPVYGTVAQPLAARPSVAPEAVPMQALPPEKPQQPLKTQTSIQVGLQLSDYRYQEPAVRMKETGLKYGLNAVLTGSLYQNWFATADLRIAVGDVRYKGTGTEDEISNVLGEARILGGYDLLFGNFAVSPYAGIGFRSLLDDGTDHVTTANAGLYRRESRYLFAPFGLNPRVLLDNGARLSLMFEYDHLLKGWQSSRLSDVNGYPDVNNPQYTGYGLRGSFMYEATKWSVGPFFNYWNVNDSKTKCASGTIVSGCWYEPHNQTLEYGLQVRYRLY